MTDIHYLKLLAQDYPTIEKAAAEIVNLTAILNRPKGTEYFFSDIHGEHEAFIHQLKSASGIIKTKIDELFYRTVTEEERIQLANLIYYPEKELERVKGDSGFDEWFKITVSRLVEVCRVVSEKSTQSKIRKKAPEDFAYIIDELMHIKDIDDKLYFHNIVDSILKTGVAEPFLTGFCKMIRDIAVDMLHIIGDIFDRGPHADLIMNELMSFHDVDIQWGNHDIAWIGAAVGNLACIASVLRIGISYNNFDLLEDSYGINLRRLSMFAAKVYKDDPCTIFMPHILDENKYDPVDPYLAAKMHKAIAVIMFKLEGKLYLNHPEYGMEDRIMLTRVNFDEGTITLNGKTYELRDKLFPTVDPADPLKLTDGEQELMNSLAASFCHSERLQKQIRFLYDKGSMFKAINTNLLYHGCIPMTKEGEFETVQFASQKLYGRNYLEYINRVVKNAVFSNYDPYAVNNDRDFMWYLWCGPKSPLFGKSKLAAFERYFIDDPTLHQEVMNPYYRLIEDRGICEKILKEFGMDPQVSHIINGHVPVRAGESPVKGGGLLFMIDGGISKAYQQKTGMGGYTFIFNSRYLALAQHMPFEEKNDKMSPDVQVAELMKKRVLVMDTDIGQTIQAKIDELNLLLETYRNGSIQEIKS